MLTLDQPMYRKLGFSWGAKHSRQQRFWLQFADDTAIVAADNASAQGQLNVFQCAWSGVGVLVCIRLDKCVALNVLKRNGIFIQTMPNLSVTEGQIPAVPLNAEFTYLGCRFSFDLKNESAIAALEEKLLNLWEITNKLKYRVTH